MVQGPSTRLSTWSTCKGALIPSKPAMWQEQSLTSSYALALAAESTRAVKAKTESVASFFIMFPFAPLVAAKLRNLIVAFDTAPLLRLRHANGGKPLHARTVGSDIYPIGPAFGEDDKFFLKL
jgi:hypothetical protein